jgi:hypothetical protein
MLSLRDRALEERWHLRRRVVIPARRPAIPPAFRGPDDEERRESGSALIWERLQTQAVRAYLDGDGALPFRN